MAVYTGNVNRVTGLSGIDTESMIDKLMKAESTKYDRMEKEEQKLTWKQEAYREIIDAMKDFQDKWFGSNRENNLGYNAAWNNYKTSVIDSSGKESSAITIKGTTSENSYKIKVSQVAQTESLTGNAAVSSELVTGANANEIMQAVKDTGELNFKFDLDGNTKEIKITKEEIESFERQDANAFKDLLNKKLKDAFGTVDGGGLENKVKVDLTEDGKIKFDGGAGHSLTIKEGKDVEKNTSTTHTGILDREKAGNYELKIAVDGKTYIVSATFESNDTADQRLQKIGEAFKKAKIDGQEGTVDISKELSLEFSADGNNLVIKNGGYNKDYKVSGSFTPQGEAKQDFVEAPVNNKSNLKKLGFDAGSVSTSITSGTRLTQAIKDFDKLFEEGGIANKDGALEFNLGDKTITINKNDTIDDLINKVNNANAGVKLGFNEVIGRFTLESTSMGANGQISVTDGNAQKLFSKLGIDVTTKENNANYTKGQDAKFSVDGIETTRPSNDINMNGLRFTINSTTEGDGVTLEAKTDTETTFNKIKEFIDDYNKVITKIESKIGEKREKTGKHGYYEPLTESEKEGMKEDEIKKWEDQAKKGILANDEILNGILSEFRSIIYKGVDVGGGKTISLYEIGITTTSDYNSGKLELDESKFKKALDERGDDIAKMFTAKDGIASKMEDVFKGAIGVKDRKDGSLRRKAGIKNTASFESNDISKEKRELMKRMQAERERLYKKEMNYFDMFARMEAAMNQQNAQMSMLLSSLGQQ